MSTEQETVGTPDYWHEKAPVTHYPYAIIGAASMRDYTVSVDVLLTQLESKLGLSKQIRLEVLIEEVEGLANAEEIAVASPAWTH